MPPKKKTFEENNAPQDGEFISPELNQQLEDQAVEITKDIVNSIQLDEEEKNELNSNEGADLQLEFDQFLNDKVEVDNTDGGNLPKLSTGVDLLDTICGGGFNIGGLTQIIGQPGSFKSTLMSQVIAHNQKVYGGKMLCVYYDTEASMTTKRLQELGVNNPPIKPYDDITIEQLFKTIEAMCAYKEAKNITIPSMICWDSIANTSTMSERGVDNINSTMGLKQKLLSQLLPRYLPKLKKYNIALVAINQLRDRLNVGMFAPAPDLMHTSGFEIPGGKAVKFNTSLMLKLQNRGELKREQYDFSGVKVEAEFLKNKSFTPYVKVNLIVDFKRGVSNFWTNFNLLSDNDVLKTGAWNYLVEYPEKKFRTKDGEELYKTDQKFREVFDANVKKVLQTQYVEKYG